MQLLLLSLGLGAVPEFVNPDKEPTMGFIPDAGDVYDDPYFVREDRDRLARLGYHIVDISLTSETPTSLNLRFSEVDCIFVAGGNTFYLLQQIKSRNLEDTIVTAVRGGLKYIGASAGAVVAGPTVEPIKGLDDPAAAPLLSSMSAMSLTDLVILPHYGKPKYEARYQQILHDYSAELKLKLLRDDQAVTVSDRGEPQTIESALILHAD